MTDTTPSATTPTANSPVPPSSTPSTTSPAFIVAKSFIKQYYEVLATSPEQIPRFYKPNCSVISHSFQPSVPAVPKTFDKPGSLLEELFTWTTGGNEGISVDFGSGAIDAQETIGGGILLVVTGQMTLPSEQEAAEKDQAARPFVHTFFLNNSAPAGKKKNFYVHNDILRFIASTTSGADSLETAATATTSASNPTDATSPTEDKEQDKEKEEKAEKIATEFEASPAPQDKPTTDKTDAAEETTATPSSSSAKEKNGKASTTSIKNKEDGEKKSTDKSKKEKSTDSSSKAKKKDKEVTPSTTATSTSSTSDAKTKSEKKKSESQPTTSATSSSPATTEQQSNNKDEKKSKKTKSRSRSSKKGSRSASPPSDGKDGESSKPKPPGSWASLVAGGGGSNGGKAKISAAALAAATVASQMTESANTATEGGKESSDKEKSKESTSTTVSSSSSSSNKESKASTTSQSKPASSSTNNNSNKNAPPPVPAAQRTPEATLFLKNVSDRSKEGEVRAMFEQYAISLNQKILGITLKATSGFCFVDFDSKIVVDTIVKEAEEIKASNSGSSNKTDGNKFVLHGRALEVGRKVPAEKSGGGRGHNFRSSSPGNGAFPKSRHHRRNSPRAGNRSGRQHGQQEKK